jgi:hypothetical protein
MTQPVTVRYEFHYVTVADGLQGGFGIGNISDDIAKGIRVGLEGVASITDVIAAEVKEFKEEVVLPPLV